MAYDCVIKGGMVLDGLGSPAFRADVAVKDGRIAEVIRMDGIAERAEKTGKAEKACPAEGCAAVPDAPALCVIDATGKYVTPGFIDIHRHADLALFREGFGGAELKQGLTTIVNGNCGISPAPLAPCAAEAGDGGIRRDFRDEVKRYIEPITGPVPDRLPTGSVSEYLDAAEKVPGGLPLNIGTLAGAGTVRASVAGYEDRPLTDREYETVGSLLTGAVADGALGVSLGLGYAPECFYTTEELIRALSPLKESGIPITAHMREEADNVLDAIKEMVTVARALKTPVHLSHLKAIGAKEPEKRTEEMLSLIRRAREEGLDVSCDAYPYTAGSTQLLHVFPPEFLPGSTEERIGRLSDPEWRERLKERMETGTDFENIVRLAGFENIFLSAVPSEKNKRYQGMSIAEAAKERGEEPFDTLFSLMAEEELGIAMIDFITTDDAIALILKEPFSNVISDSTYPLGGLLHPRVYGTFARILEKFVRDEKRIPLPDAVAAMTSRAADALGLSAKGRIEPGADADICVFGISRVHEPGTYEKPDVFAEGMDEVLVNGVPVIHGGAFTGSRPGRVLRRKKQ